MFVASASFLAIGCTWNCCNCSFGAAFMDGNMQQNFYYNMNFIEITVQWYFIRNSVQIAYLANHVCNACGANQWTGFYMITASVVKGLNTLWIVLSNWTTEYPVEYEQIPNMGSSKVYSSASTTPPGFLFIKFSV